MANTNVKEHKRPIKIIGFGKPEPIAGHPDYKKEVKQTEVEFIITADSKDSLGWGNELKETRTTNPKEVIPLLRDYLNKVVNQNGVDHINFSIEIEDK